MTYTNRWNRVWTLPEITKQLGADHVAYIRALPHPVGYCESRAAGWWTANEPEAHTQYKSLAAILKAEGVQS